MESHPSVYVPRPVPTATAPEEQLGEVSHMQPGQGEPVSSRRAAWLMGCEAGRWMQCRNFTTENSDGPEKKTQTVQEIPNR